MKDEIQSLVAPENLPNTEIFTGETLVDKFARRIVSCWHRTTEDILELAHECADATDALSGPDKLPAKKALIDRLPFDGSTFSKLVAIGHDVRLQSLAGLLPHSFTTLYELTQFDDDQLTAAIIAGAIHPQVRRTEIEGLRKTNLTVKKAAELPAAVQQTAASGRFELVIPADLEPAHRAGIDKLLVRLHKKFGVEIAPMNTSEATSNAVSSTLSSVDGGG
jgi:hypothetical protein